MPLRRGSPRSSGQHQERLLHFATAAVGRTFFNEGTGDKMGLRRTTWLAVGIGVGIVAGWAGVAFACSPSPRVSALLPESASPGSTVVVQGQAVTGSGVDIRWNGVRGKRLAVAEPDASGAFSVPVQVPDVAPGVYSLTLVDDSVSIGRMAFEVIGQAGSRVPGVQVWPNMSAQPSIASPVAGGANAGMVMLGLGLVILAAGSTVAVARRRVLAA